MDGYCHEDELPAGLELTTELYESSYLTEGNVGVRVYPWRAIADAACRQLEELNALRSRKMSLQDALQMQHDQARNLAVHQTARRCRAQAETAELDLAHTRRMNELRLEHAQLELKHARRMFEIEERTAAAGQSPVEHSGA